MKAEQDGLPTPQRYWSAATIWMALTLSVLDGSIANVALPTIAGDLSAPAAGLDMADRLIRRSERLK
jgi:DHA2 family multidrug resistance protein-like MFS transporter